MRKLHLVSVAQLVALSALATGCGETKIPPNPSPFVGNYTVTITANGQDDMDRMYVTIGSALDVLFSFTNGVSEIRGALAGTMATTVPLTLPRQTLDVNHSIGPAKGVADGSGTFTLDGAGGSAVDFTFHLTTAGYGPTDGASPSGLGGAGPVDYHVVGMRDTP